MTLNRENTVANRDALPLYLMFLFVILCCLYVFFFRFWLVVSVSASSSSLISVIVDISASQTQVWWEFSPLSISRSVPGKALKKIQLHQLSKHAVVDHTQFQPWIFQKCIYYSWICWCVYYISRKLRKKMMKVVLSRIQTNKWTLDRQQYFCRIRCGWRIFKIDMMMFSINFLVYLKEFGFLSLEKIKFTPN